MSTKRSIFAITGIFLGTRCGFTAYGQTTAFTWDFEDIDWDALAGGNGALEVPFELNMSDSVFDPDTGIAHFVAWEQYVVSPGDFDCDDDGINEPDPWNRFRYIAFDIFNNTITRNEKILPSEFSLEGDPILGAPNGPTHIFPNDCDGLGSTAGGVAIALAKSSNPGVVAREPAVAWVVTINTTANPPNTEQAKFQTKIFTIERTPTGWATGAEDVTLEANAPGTSPPFGNDTYEKAHVLAMSIDFAYMDPENTDANSANDDHAAIVVGLAEGCGWEGFDITADAWVFYLERLGPFNPGVSNWIGIPNTGGAVPKPAPIQTWADPGLCADQQGTGGEIVFDLPFTSWSWVGGVSLAMNETKTAPNRPRVAFTRIEYIEPPIDSPESEVYYWRRDTPATPPLLVEDAGIQFSNRQAVSLAVGRTSSVAHIAYEQDGNTSALDRVRYAKQNSAESTSWTKENVLTLQNGNADSATQLRLADLMVDHTLSDKPRVMIHKRDGTAGALGIQDRSTDLFSKNLGTGVWDLERAIAGTREWPTADLDLISGRPVVLAFRENNAGSLPLARAASGVSLVVEVLDPTGNRISGASVWLDGPFVRPLVSYPRTPDFEQEFGTSGNYISRAVPDGAYMLNVTHPQFTGTSQQVDITYGQPNSVSVPLSGGGGGGGECGAAILTAGASLARNAHYALLPLAIAVLGIAGWYITQKLRA